MAIKNPNWAQRIAQGISPEFCGTVLWLCWVALTLISSAFAYGVSADKRPVLSVTMLLVAMSAVHLYAVFIAYQSGANAISVKTVVGFALAMRFVAVFSTPIQELDYYRYLWDGETVLAGANPFQVTPQQVLSAVSTESTTQHVPARLINVCRERPRVRETAERVHYGELPSIYPPVSLALFTAAVMVTPESASLETAVVILKWFIVAFDFGVVLLLISLLKIVRLQPALAISYAWCPLVIKEFANSGHLDAICNFFVIGSVVAIVAFAFPGISRTVAVTRLTGRRLLYLSSVLLGLAIGAKLFPVVLVPLMSGLVFRKAGKTAAVSWLMISGLISVVTCWPMLGRTSAGGDTVSDIAHTPPANEQSGQLQGVTSTDEPVDAGVNVYIQPPVPDPELEPFPAGSEASDAQINVASQPPRNSLKVFLTSWKMNDLLFMIMETNLTPERQQIYTRDHWFVLVPDSVRESVCGVVGDGFGVDVQTVPFLLTRGILALLFFVLAIRWAIVGMTRQTSKEWLSLVFSTLAWFWMLSPTLNPWYWTWALPFVLFARNRGWFLVSALVLLYYLRFWFENQWGSQTVAGTQYQGEAFFHYVAVWGEHLPWMLLVAAEAWKCRSLRSAPEVEETLSRQ